MTARKLFPVDGGWRPLLKDLGLRADQVLTRAGLPQDLFSRPGAGLTTAEYFRFWRSLEQDAADPLLPLRLVDAVTSEVFVPPIFAALCSRNLHQASQRLSQYKRLVAPMQLEVQTHRRRDELSLSPSWLDTAVSEVPFIVVAAELAFWVRLARMATREPVRACRVTLPQPPAAAHATAYAQWFGVPITRGAKPSVCFSGADAERPFLTVNEPMWKMFEPELRRRLSELDETATLAERVQAVLLDLLPSGEATIDAVASRLALGKRTLQRQLGDEDRNFRGLLDHTREGLSRHYLTQTQLPMIEIAFLLGFEDPNSFFRAFQGWTGETPSLLRQRARDGVPTRAQPALGGASTPSRR